MFFDDAEPFHPLMLADGVAASNAAGSELGTERAVPVDRWPFSSDFHAFALRPVIDDGLTQFGPEDRTDPTAMAWLRPDNEDAMDVLVQSSSFSDPPEGTSEPIVVTGTRLATGGFSWTSAGGGGLGLDEPLSPNEEDQNPFGEDSPAAPDESEIEVTINIARELTATEKQALLNLLNSIAAIDAAIKALPANAILVLPNGKNVTGADLKIIWAKTDFTIYENEPFGNLSYRGEANVIGQDTQNVAANDYQISFNVHNQGLDGYDDSPGGMNYLVAHELGHITQWWTTNFNNEQMANDIGRAILANGRLPYLANPNGGGYSTSSPMQFSTS